MATSRVRSPYCRHRPRQSGKQLIRNSWEVAVLGMAVIGGKADIVIALRNVCFRPKTDILDPRQCAYPPRGPIDNA
jgi:hypothetical protein